MFEVAPVLKNLKFSLETEGLACDLIPSNWQNWILAAVGKDVCLYEINDSTGVLKLLSSAEADFSKEDPSVNKCIFSNDESLVVSGGDDGVARVFEIKNGQLTLIKELF